MTIPGELMPQEASDVIDQCAHDGAIHCHSFEEVAARTQRGLLWAKELVGREIPL